MIVIDHKHYTEDEVRKVFELVKELIQLNEEQNAKLIAFNAKLTNEENKVKDLKWRLSLLQQEILNR